MGMDDSRRKLFEDLERYIQEHWIPEGAESDKAGREETCFSEDSLNPEGRDSFPEDLPSPEDEAWFDGELCESFESDMIDAPFGISLRDDIRKGEAPGSSLPKAQSLEDLIGEVGKSFHESLFEKIDESGMTDVEVYKRANIDRKLFSKIRNNPAYHPRKNTVLALAISMRLDLAETEDLLARAEYAFSPGSKSDVIVRYFIERGVHDIHTINIALYEHDLSILE